MYRQTFITLPKIASRFPACETHGLNLHSKLRTCGAKGSVIAWRNNEEKAHFFTKTWDGRSLKETSAVLGPLIGSTLTDGGLSSAYKSNGPFGQDRTAGLKSSSGGGSLFLQNASFHRVPCRNLKTAGGKELETDQNDSSFLARMRNKFFAASLLVASLSAPPEEPNGRPDPDTQSNWVTACHESGHALVAHYTKEAPPVTKGTIFLTNTSAGMTPYMPCSSEDTWTQRRARLDVTMGGIAAEEVMFGPEKITPGASADLKEATSIAASMVKEWGMPEKCGLRSQGTELSPTMAKWVDQETQRILQESHEQAKNICRDHQTKLLVLAKALVKYKTLDGDAIKILLIRARLSKKL